MTNANSTSLIDNLDLSSFIVETFINDLSGSPTMRLRFPNDTGMSIISDRWGGVEIAVIRWNADGTFDFMRGFPGTDRGGIIRVAGIVDVVRIADALRTNDFDLTPDTINDWDDDDWVC